jgi:hypothetical protein
MLRIFVLTGISKVQALASKQYISIIRLFNHCGITLGNDFNLTRAKKQLQAEFGIAQGGFIEVDGFTYTKHDVFEEIENPDFSRRLVFHRQIWEFKQILQLLEKSTADLITLRDDFGPFWGDNEFDEFFSPYFAGPFQYILRTLLTDFKLNEAGSLLAYEEFLQVNEREEAFRPLRAFLEENRKLLRNVNGGNYSIMRSKIKHWIDEDWHLFFNNLPNEFYEEKNEIITRFINLCVDIQKSHRSDCRDISSQLMRLTDTPESLRGLIVSNHAVYLGSSSGSARSNWRIIAWFVFILIAIGRFTDSEGCGEKKGYENFESYPPPVYILDSNAKKLFDSIRIIQDSSVNLVPSEKFK